MISYRIYENYLVFRSMHADKSEWKGPCIYVGNEAFRGRKLFNHRYMCINAENGFLRRKSFTGVNCPWSISFRLVNWRFFLQNKWIRNVIYILIRKNHDSLKCSKYLVKRFLSLQAEGMHRSKCSRN